ncbi:hypothetical protein HGRIS_007611 [Hohenbuehelia grisea]|uniref:BTB domain-containing protein n=1 Tax=Hohenbuehelia grisea TaxID=104357 RepID=A0ABR3J5E4_9AGAR
MTPFTAWECSNPDFTIRSIPDDERIPVRREVLRCSEVFNDMFAFCDTDSQNSDNAVDLDEKADTLRILFRLLHDPPPPPVRLAEYNVEYEEKFKTQIRTRKYEPDTVIPWPLLPSLFTLADKYSLSRNVDDSLQAHLTANAPLYPLEIYGFACSNGLTPVAITASQYLAPVASYSLEDVKAIPTVMAYHKIVQLQSLRVRTLHTLLLEADVFPHDYGLCSTHHQATRDLWDQTRTKLLGSIETGKQPLLQATSASRPLPNIGH